MGKKGRIAERFAELRARGEKGLIVYLTAFDPMRERSLQLLFDAARGGADVLEIGVPWSDPTADGPVIQRAMLRGLSAGASLPRVLGLIGELRQAVTVPIVLFGYYNPVLCYGPARFARDAAAAGIDGVLMVDLPPEESAELDLPLREAGIKRVPLLGPTTSPQRAAKIASGPASGGFAYYVALTGVTGAGHLNLHDVAARTAALRPAVNLPLAVGFGVKDGAMAAALAHVPACDAVVVGSAIVQAAEQGDDVAALVANLKRAVSSAAQSR
jgi:tryptophan synthase alpha chain